MSILTDDEKPKLPRAAVDEHNLHGGRMLYTSEQMRAYADARETAVLAKLAQQEPVACPTCKGECGHEKALSSTNYTWVKCADCGGTGKAAPVPAVGQVPRIVVNEAMHVAACKVLIRAHGLDGLPQRMMDAMLAAAPEAPKGQP